jgi:hypothetical protein
MVTSPARSTTNTVAPMAIAQDGGEAVKKWDRGSDAVGADDGGSHMRRYIVVRVVDMFPRLRRICSRGILDLGLLDRTMVPLLVSTSLLGHQLGTCDA